MQNSRTLVRKFFALYKNFGFTEDKLIEGNIEITDLI